MLLAVSLIWLVADLFVRYKRAAQNSQCCLISVSVRGLNSSLGMQTGQMTHNEQRNEGDATSPVDRAHEPIAQKRRRHTRQSTLDLCAADKVKFRRRSIAECEKFLNVDTSPMSMKLCFRALAAGALYNEKRLKLSFRRRCTMYTSRT